MTDQQLSEAEIVKWLRANPDFFTRHTELITGLAIPHESGTTSLVERQVELLRDENQQLRRRLDHLTGVAGENERLMQRLHRLALELVATESCDMLYSRLETGLRNDFRADAICLMLDPARAAEFCQSPISALPDKQPAWLQKLLASGKPQCGRLTREKRENVFGEAGAALGSVALVPLGNSGLLGIGAESSERFHPDMGTLFLELLRETLQYRMGVDAPETAKPRQRA